ncbi:MAG TPA: methylated-DNA--[protein]-cysteine S-methyltransferase, partial [Candidatus Acidoferrum sp.]|nr:methylated-DNA--[protein]-cysteine S-methyltransferase [Candidatus Acidoferrum sp.]
MPAQIARPALTEYAFAAIPGPWGPIHVAAGRNGVVALEILTPPDVFSAALSRRLHAEIEMASRAAPAVRVVLGRAVASIEGFFDGAPDPFEGLDLDLAGRPDWDRRIFAGVRQIRAGSVTSYGRLARLIGSPGAARAAGGAVGRNPIGLAIPCHRVIAGDGTIGGYGGDWWGGRERLLEIKRELLEREGVTLPA